MYAAPCLQFDPAVRSAAVSALLSVVEALQQQAGGEGAGAPGSGSAGEQGPANKINRASRSVARAAGALQRRLLQSVKEECIRVMMRCCEEQEEQEVMRAGTEGG